MAVVLVQQEKKEESRKEPLRTEDRRLLTGRGHFVEDFSAQNQAFMALVHSPVAHSKIKRLDLSKVSSSPNFIAFLTCEDLVREGIPPLSQGFIPPKRTCKRYPLAFREVKFVGEPVAAILAKDRGSAEDLAELVDVEYEQLPAVTTLDEAKRCEALVYSEWKTNLSQSIHQKKGNAENAISSAKYVVKVSEGISRQYAAPIEPHAVIASYDKERDLFEVLATVQSVHNLLDLLSSELKMSRRKFHVRVMDMGGGFGSKAAPEYPWTLIACLFAKKTGLTVRWEASRTEEFLESTAGRDEYSDITLACDEDGRIVALKARIDCDIGVPGNSSFMSAATVATMPGPYEIPNLDLLAESYVTNKMPIGPMRGAGRPEGCYFTERAMEIMAKKIGLDPIEFRLRNIAKPKSPSSEDYQSLFDMLAKSADYAGILRWRDDLNSRFRLKNNGSAQIAGIGLSLCGGEMHFPIRSILASIPLRSLISVIRLIPRFRSFSTESGRITLDKKGQVLVYTGSSPHGQGHETAFAQLASEELGVKFENVKVIWGDTALIPKGVGTFGSRSSVAGGSAVVDASRRLKSNLLEKASRSLGINREMLDIRNGKIVRRAQQENSLIDLGELLSRLGLEAISADSKFTPKSIPESSGVHLCALTLDTETGDVSIEKYAIAEDCGRIINKAIVEGQLHGGVVCGIGGALLEKLVYDNDGNLLTTSFMDYSIPTSSDIPNIEIFHKVTPSEGTLSHTKGVGESGTIASYAAIINALNDALSSLKVAEEKGIRELNVAPVTPEMVHAALNT